MNTATRRQMGFGFLMCASLVTATVIVQSVRAEAQDGASAQTDEAAEISPVVGANLSACEPGATKLTFNGSAFNTLPHVNVGSTESAANKATWVTTHQYFREPLDFPLTVRVSLTSVLLGTEAAAVESVQIRTEDQLTFPFVEDVLKWEYSPNKLPTVQTPLLQTKRLRDDRVLLNNLTICARLQPSSSSSTSTSSTTSTSTTSTSTSTTSTTLVPLSSTIGSCEKIAFSSRRAGKLDIFVVSADGSGTVRNITNNPADDYAPSWSPNASQLVFSSDRSGNSEVWVASSDGTGIARNLTNHPAQDYYSTLSPDGTRIAFVSDRSGNSEVWITNADGSGAPVNITNSPGDDYAPAWSPDSSRIAFNRNQSGQSDIWVRNSDGSGVAVNITNNSASDTSAAWAPDGLRIAFSSDRSGNNDEVYVGNADGSGPVTNITNSPANENSPDWSPDGSRIVFASGRTGDFDVFVGRADGTGTPLNISSHLDDDYEPKWAPSPNVLCPLPASSTTIPPATAVLATTTTPTSTSTTTTFFALVFPPIPPLPIAAVPVPAVPAAPAASSPTTLLQTVSVTTMTGIAPAVLVAMEKVPAAAPQVAVLANQLEPAYTGVESTTLLLVAFLLAAVGVLLLMVEPRSGTSKTCRLRP
jgi:Tol biopolymer transport system component